jgi:hypothetical protein
MRSKLPWPWVIGSLVAVALSAAAFLYYRFNDALRGDYETIRVAEMIEDHVKAHEGNWPTSWEDLDRTETAKRLAPLDSSYWRKYTTVDFTVRSEQLVGDPELIYRAVMPVRGEYVVYPRARQDLDRVLQAIREAKRSPTPRAR